MIRELISSLGATSAAEEKMNLRSFNGNVPSEAELIEMIGLVQAVVFPQYYSKGKSLEFCLVNIRDLLSKWCSTDTAVLFVKQLPQIKRLLLTDVEAVAHNDPAVVDFSEVVLSYPAIKVMSYYRTAHVLLKLGVKMIPRMLTEIAHSLTGIDIHPAASIGEYFAIDHGTGVVVGETCIIGSHVMLYQGVTLGAKNFTYSPDGKPLNVPRHPILEDNVTVYSNTSILGRVTIGHDTIIGGNIWLTHDVPPNSKLVQAVYKDRD